MTFSRTRAFSVRVPSLPPNLERTSLVVVEVVSRAHREYIHVLPLGEYMPEPPVLPVVEEPTLPPVVEEPTLPFVEEPTLPPVLSIIEEATRPHRPIWRRILGRSRRIVREQYHRLTA